MREIQEHIYKVFARCELVDVQLLWVGEDGLTIGGFEEILEVHYAQTWLARPAG